MKRSDLTPCVAPTGSPCEPEHVCISVKASRLSCALSFLPIRTGEHGLSMSCTSLLALNISPTLHVSVYTIRYLPEGENPRVFRAGVVEGSSLRALPLPLSQQCLPIPMWVQARWNHAVCWDCPARRKGRRRQRYNIQLQILHVEYTRPHDYGNRTSHFRLPSATYLGFVYLTEKKKKSFFFLALGGLGCNYLLDSEGGPEAIT